MGKNLRSLKLEYLKRILSAYVLDSRSSNLAFWHTPLRSNVLKKGDLSALGAYPQNFEDKIGVIGTTDSCGVIMLDYKGLLGLQYNPNAIAQLCLGYYDRILFGDDCKKEFFTQAAFFLDHGREIGDGILLWEYTFPFEMRNYLSSPWRSALAQGQGISVCLRAYQLGGGEDYLEAARMAFKAFYHLAKEHPGGVLDDSQGYVWLEEYIVTPANHVLNGFIWALWGVRDYAVFLNDTEAWSLWQNCLRTLRKNLHRYDLGFWTTYDIVQGKWPVMPCSTYYQELHSIQMRAMYQLTGDELFARYAAKWQRQLSNPLFQIVSQTWKAYFKLRWF
jgi:hypothetical protein